MKFVQNWSKYPVVLHICCISDTFIRFQTSGKGLFQCRDLAWFDTSKAFNSVLDRNLFSRRCWQSAEISLELWSDFSEPVSSLLGTATLQVDQLNFRTTQFHNSANAEYLINYQKLIPIKSGDRKATNLNTKGSHNFLTNILKKKNLKREISLGLNASFKCHLQ